MTALFELFHVVRAIQLVALFGNFFPKLPVGRSRPRYCISVCQGSLSADDFILFQS